MDSIYEWLQKVIPNPVLMHLVISVGIFILIITLGRIVNLVLKIVIKPLVGKTKTTLDDKIVQLIVKFSNRIFFVAGLYLAIKYFVDQLKTDKRIENYMSDGVYRFTLSLSSLINDVLYVVTVLFFIYALYHLFSIVMDYYLEKKDVQKGERSAYDLIPFIKKLILVILFTIGLLIILNKFKVDVSGIVLSLGIASLAIALAAQETLSNMIAGFVILVDRPFRIGDRIRLPSGEIGDVFEIGMRSTKFLDFDNNLIIVPNAEIVKTIIQNLTYPNTVSRIVVDVGVAYDTNLEKAKGILLELAKNHSLVTLEFEPQVFVVNFSASSIDLRLIARTLDYRNVYQIQSDLRESIKSDFKKNGIEIPFPQMVIHRKEK
ncbi:MAG: mechanosensitive ion channel [Bacteroidetes bacterium]|nr:mechanosensitive ion channel [Bacteroidota bacterium]